MSKKARRGCFDNGSYLFYTRGTQVEETKQFGKEDKNLRFIMTIKEHKHIWREVPWKFPNVRIDTVRDLELPQSLYDIPWKKSVRCTALGCDAVVICSDNLSIMQQAQGDGGWLPYFATPGGPLTGIIVDLEQMYRPTEHALR